MFSQFSQLRQAVETFSGSQHSPKSSQDTSADERNVRSSLDSQAVRASISSSTHLAESALSNLRKTLAAQRPASPGIVGQPAASPESPAKPPSVHRTTLEDRLRAKFAIGDASNPSSRGTSTRTSPAPVTVVDHPLSPKSTPLPESPALRTAVEHPLSPTSSPLPDSPAPAAKIEAPQARQALTLEPPTLSLFDATSASPAEESSRSPEAQINPTSPQAALSNEPEAEVSNEPAAEALSVSPSNPSPTDPPSEPSPKDHSNPSSESSSEGDATVLEDPTESTVDLPDESVLSDPSLHSVSDPVREILPDKTLDETETVEKGVSEGESATMEQEHADEQVFPVEETLQGVSSLADSYTADEIPSNPPNDDTTLREASPPPPPELAVTPPSDPPSTPSTSAEFKPVQPDIDALQKRLKLVEQRFTDVSTSFKRLQAEKIAADRVLQELTSVESVHEVDALRDYLQNINFKTEMAQDEIKRLTGKLTRQDERIEELRDIHRLESKSQTELIDKSRSQVEEAEKLLKASQSSTTQMEEDLAKRKTDIERLQAEVDQSKASAKEEEEKRVKAITLLKTVRQKLVKAEKERDDAARDIQSLKALDKDEREKDRAEKSRLQSEVDKANAERETAVLGLRAQFDKEVAALKDRYEKELAAMRTQFELEAITTKSVHSKEIETKNSRISNLDTSVRSLSREKDELFDQLQLRQAELESSQSLLETLQSQNTELQYQLREANDRLALLNDELVDSRREQEIRPMGASPSAEEVTRLLSAAESKYESRISDLRKRLTEVERERDEGEADWSRKLSDKAREVEAIKALLSLSKTTREEEQEGVNSLRAEIEALQDDIRSHKKHELELEVQLTKGAELELAAKTQLTELSTKAANLQQHIEESKSREAQLRAHNKTLREELRKVQSSAALLEKQRNPGVGYWASRQESSTDLRSPRSSVSDLASQDVPSRPGTPSTAKSDEEVNMEYLRNVIIQFLEHKEMRPHLVRILSTILRFTPQETRRIISKV